MLEAWGTPLSIRDEPGDRVVLTFKNDVGDGWAFAVGPPLPPAWILAASSTHTRSRSAEFFFRADDRLEVVRLRDREGRLTVVE